jgi:tetratricopeptide (TPR) repeat protein
MIPGRSTADLPPLPATAAQHAGIEAASRRLAEAPGEVGRLVAAARARDPVWRYAEAIDLYTRALATRPDDWRLLVSRGHRLIRLRRLDEARADLERAVALDPYGFNSHYLLALTRYLQREFDAAADAYGHMTALAADRDALARAAAGTVPGDPRHCMVMATDVHSRVASPRGATARCGGPAATTRRITCSTRSATHTRSGRRWPTASASGTSWRATSGSLR